VLALEIVAARGEIFAFLPAMAFTVVLVTNLFIVWGAVRSGQVAAIEAPAAKPLAAAELKTPVADTPSPALPVPQTES